MSHQSQQALFDLVQVDAGVLAERLPGGSDGNRFQFGGRVVAQSMWAAVRAESTKGKMVVALRTSVLRPTVHEEPMVFRVESLLEGRTVAARLVRACQRRGVVAVTSVTFHADEPRPTAPTMTSDGTDGGVPTDAMAWRPRTDLRTLDRFEIRSPQGQYATGYPRHPWWARPRDRDSWPSGDAVDPALLAFLTDAGVPYTMAGVHPGDPPPDFAASLDHSIWFHRPFRFDDWVRIEATPTPPLGHRVFGTGHVVHSDGTLLATWAQQALLRRSPPAAAAEGVAAVTQIGTGPGSA